MMLPRCHDTDQSFCPCCFEPCDEYHVEAFEVLDVERCRECGEIALEMLAAGEWLTADDVIEAGDFGCSESLKPGFRRLGQ